VADDIVTRLRSAADEHLDRACKCDDPGPHGAHGDICHEQVMTEAADEIEELRARLHDANEYRMRLQYRWDRWVVIDQAVVRNRNLSYRSERGL
jgi:hypothetical protein